jgi:hypothetical protein
MALKGCAAWRHAAKSTGNNRGGWSKEEQGPPRPRPEGTSPNHRPDEKSLSLTRSQGNQQTGSDGRAARIMHKSMAREGYQHRN